MYAVTTRFARQGDKGFGFRWTFAVFRGKSFIKILQQIG